MNKTERPVTLAERRQAKIDALQAKQKHDLATATARGLHDAIRPLLKDPKAARAAAFKLIDHLGAWLGDEDKGTAREPKA